MKKLVVSTIIDGFLLITSISVKVAKFIDNQSVDVNKSWIIYFN